MNSALESDKNLTPSHSSNLSEHSAGFLELYLLCNWLRDNELWWMLPVHHFPFLPGLNPNFLLVAVGPYAILSVFKPSSILSPTMTTSEKLEETLPSICS